MYSGLIQVALLHSNPAAIDVFRMLTKIGAFQSESRNAENLIVAMRLAEDAYGMWCWPLKSAQVRAAYHAAKQVTAAPFMHLSGKAIGEAMAVERVKRIEAVL
jgi:hypothetical protein